LLGVRLSCKRPELAILHKHFVKFTYTNCFGFNLYYIYLLLAVQKVNE
jgi:hypothetical protein